MKQLSALLFALLFSSTFLFGQQQKGGDPEERIEQMNKKMKTELDLNADQYAKVSEVNKAFVYETMELRGPDNRDAMKAARDAYMVKMEGILTQEQMTKFKEMQQERRRRMKGQKRGDMFKE